MPGRMKEVGAGLEKALFLNFKYCSSGPCGQFSLANILNLIIPRFLLISRSRQVEGEFLWTELYLKGIRGGQAKRLNKIGFSSRIAGKV